MTLNRHKHIRHIFAWLAAFLFLFYTPVLDARAATEWPSSTGISAEGGIVMDANTGAVIWGQNIHQTYYPASITKVLTALVVLENVSDLDEMVTFSDTAVYSVEPGGNTVSMNVGDEMSVRDCLYAMLLHSANEVAAALAEHVAGSISDFAVLMNEKAAMLGCRNTNFMNPSGLHNDEQVTTPYDMALITKAAFENPTFVEIDSTLSYKLPASQMKPDGQGVSCEHRMMQERRDEYYPGVIGGKTGYTSKAMNTLVTCAEKNDMRLVVVILKSNWTHYADTKALLDFGFDHFKNEICGSEEVLVTLPKDAVMADAVSQESFDLGPDAPADATAKIVYTYAGSDRVIGSSYIEAAQESVYESEHEGEEAAPVETPSVFPWKTVLLVAAVVILAALAGGGIFYFHHGKKKEESRRQEWKERRMKRLKEIGVSTEEYQSILKQKRTGKTDTTQTADDSSASGKEE